MIGSERGAEAGGLSRRELLRRAGLVGVAATVPAAALASEASSVREREGLESLTAAEADAVEAIVDRLIPSDANGPGAAEARVARYIDRALDGELARSAAPTPPGSPPSMPTREPVRGRPRRPEPGPAGRCPPGDGAEQVARVSRRARGRSSTSSASTRSRACSETRSTEATRNSSAGTSSASRREARRSAPRSSRWTSRSSRRTSRRWTTRCSRAGAEGPQHNGRHHADD